ncbi:MULTISPECIES: phosphoglycolate phosphatase [Brachymonas]|uniref:phosphoglycolate phosphatase n=1 Tax=Brachymonas TaxID=28219 RepID=UPI001697BC71|nr:phosphoglycolate phosphatase [Brachymonas sp. J145]MEE1654467.1 phosphoglycolate phosphatase [Brachymonas sp. J145]NLX16980.1 phosphoglycolate phosphatase [Ramlibacter sp.]
MSVAELRWPCASQPLAVQGVMIDLDGTMVDTMGDFDLALNAMLAELQLPAIARSTIGQLVGKGSEHLIRQTLQQVGADAARFDTAFASYQRHYGEINGQQSRLFDGVQQGLEQLQALGLPLACLTNKPQAHAEVLLQRLGIAGYFRCVFGGDAFARKKPDPLPLLETARALGTDPAVTLMLGDSSNDAQAAHAAGCPVLLVDYGYNHGQPIREVPAQGYLSSMAQLQGVSLARPGAIC